MRPSLDPRGILLAHTLPALLLAYLLGDLFQFIRPSLGPEALELWRLYAWWLGIGTTLATGYAVYCILQRKPIHIAYGVLVFVAYVPLLWWSMEELGRLFPSGVPFWMVPEEARLYGIRILSATLLQGLLVLVGSSLPSGDRGRPARDLLIAAAIPLTCYLFVQVVRPFNGGIDFERHAWLVLMVVLVVAFLFFVFRGIFAILRRRAANGPLALVTRVFVALVFPITGLIANNGWMDRTGMDLFGDLSHPGFYVVVVLNAVAVIWGSSDDPRLRLVQFALRAIGFSYVLYFFVLFLPFLPLSIMAILAVGLGFLLLAPVLLFLLQGMQLWNDLRFLRQYHALPGLLGGLLLGLCVLPGLITAVYLQQRSTLHRALDLVYSPQPGDDAATVDASSLAPILQHVASNKERRGWAKEHTPFLTPWYNRVVLDNLTLSDLKLNQLERIYLGRPSVVITPGADRVQRERTCTLDTVTTRATYDAQQQVWRTWVDLRMTNRGSWQGEYSTVFELPPGAYISDEYLVIEGRQEKGILAERKAATWVYQQIRDFRRDPSLTTYAGPDAISLKVFPLADNETREAGFEVLHKEPITLRIDTFQVVLGDPQQAGPAAPVLAPDSSLVYLSAAMKATLPLTQRPADVHLVLDAGVGSVSERRAILQRVDQALADQGVPKDRITAHITDAGTESLPWNEEARARYMAHEARGGFFSDRPIRQVLRAACERPNDRRPIIVLAPALLNGSSDPGVLLDGLLELASCQPEAPHFLQVEYDGTLTERSFADPYMPVGAAARILRPEPVVAWPAQGTPRAYFRADGRPGTALLVPTHTNAPLRLRDWNDALALEARWRTHELEPERGTAGWLAIVRGSFQAQVLSPVTAWICLESELQRNALLKKQEEVLNANVNLDAGEEELMRMIEPEAWLLLLAPLLLIVLRRRTG